jgi:hypothetical protein
VNASGSRLQNAGDHAQCRRFACAIWAEESKQLAIGHRQIDVIDGGE